MGKWNTQSEIHTFRRQQSCYLHKNLSRDLHQKHQIALRSDKLRLLKIYKSNKDTIGMDTIHNSWYDVDKGEDCIKDYSIHFHQSEDKIWASFSSMTQTIMTMMKDQTPMTCHFHHSMTSLILYMLTVTTTTTTSMTRQHLTEATLCIPTLETLTMNLLTLTLSIQPWTTLQKPLFLRSEHKTGEANWWICEWPDSHTDRNACTA